MVGYGLLLKKSWNDLKKNLIVFFPLLVSFISFIVLGLICLGEFLIFLSMGFTFTKASLTSVNFWVVAGVVLFIDFIILLLVGAIVRASEARIFNLVTNNKKASSNDSWIGIKQFTGLFFKLEIIKLLIVLLPLLLLGLLTLLGFMVSKTLGIGLLVLFGIICLLYFIGALIFLGLGLFFIEPIISMGKTNSTVTVMKQAFKYTKENLGHMFLTWLITAGVGILLNVFMKLINLPSVFSLFYLIFSVPVIMIVSVVVGTWLRLFIYNSYFNSKIKN